MLETLTYSCINPSDLHDLSAKLDELTKEFRTKLPKSEGLVLQPNARRAARHRAQRITKSVICYSIRRSVERVSTSGGWEWNCFVTASLREDAQPWMLGDRLNLKPWPQC